MVIQTETEYILPYINAHRNINKHTILITNDAKDKGDGI